MSAEDDACGPPFMMTSQQFRDALRSAHRHCLEVEISIEAVLAGNPTPRLRDNLVGVVPQIRALTAAIGYAIQSVVNRDLAPDEER